ncbi:MAG: N-acetylmuramoyl-L-alanine amidase [Gammaproteobacteria bacterium]
MSRLRNVLLLLPLLFPLLWLTTGVAAAAISIDNVRAWRAPDYTRFVFDVSGLPSYQVLPDAAPGRVVVDFRDATLNANLDSVDLKDSPVRRLRSGLQPDGTLRIVLDLDGTARVNSFALAPNEQYGHRLVVDLFDQAAAAPEEKPAAPAPPMAPTAAPETVRKVVVAIDAGHGGEDPGAIGPKKTREKDVVLAIARAVRDHMRNDPGLHPVLIRDGDYYIGLRERRTIARKRHNADIFVSIHADAFTRREARGASVFAVSRRGATSTLAAFLADSENRADLVGGVDPRAQDDVMSVISDLILEGTMSHSLHVGSSVLQEMGTFARLHKPRVEQAGFMVLKEPNMPSILVETGFISNPEEERLLGSAAYQQRLGKAIASGVRRYFERYPPPGTWFAANREGRTVAAIEPVTASDADPVPTGSVSPPKNPPTAKAPQRSGETFIQHKVTRGQSLGYIANKYGVTQAAIKRANNLGRDSVYIGETLKIPRP